MELELSIIIVNWNGMEFLPACLKSIAENPPSAPYEVVVVDNASTDGSAEWLRSEVPSKIIGNERFRLIESGSNLGFGRANNLAFNQSDSELILVLNPDTMVSAGAIDRMTETIGLDDSYGACAPRLVNPDGTLQVSVWGFPPTPLAILVDGLKLGRILPRKWLARWLYADNWDHSSRETVPVVAAAAMLCRKAMIDEIGGFDQTFHMYGEDLEWCARIFKSRWKIVFEPEAIVSHLGGQSSDQRWDPLEKSLVSEAGFLIFQQRSLSPWWVMANTLAKTAVLSVLWTKHLQNRKIRSGLSQIILLQLRAFRESFFSLLR